MVTYSLRLMLVFLLAAIFLNVSNYFFVRAYNSTRQSQYKIISKMEKFQPVDQNYWVAVEKYYDHIEPSNYSRDNDSELHLTTHSGFYTKSKNPTTARKEMENCPELPPGLGPELVNRSIIVKYLKNFNATDVRPGGRYQPKKCKSLQSVAIIIAYRGCKHLLNTFMNIIHPFLIKQQLDYQIFVVEQSNKTQPFNRGKLLNVGFMEATRSRKDGFGFQCIILHEPHIVPADTRNLYRCGWYPRQLASVVERPAKLPYIPLLGGAVAITPEQFLSFNGFSNDYWGNDADYTDLYNRINASHFFIENSVPHVGKYKSIRRGLALWNKSEYVSTASPLYLLDGLSSLSYTVDSFELKRLFTYLQVNIDPVETKTKMDIYKQLNPVIYKTTQQMKPYNTTFFYSRIPRLLEHHFPGIPEKSGT